MTEPSLYTGYDEQALVDALPRMTHLLPTQRTDMTRVRDKKLKRRFREVYPAAKRQQLMLDVAQGTSEWLTYREGDPVLDDGGSFGASSLATTGGHDEYDTLEGLWLKDTGRITVKAGQTLDDYFPLDRGHVTEDIALEIYRIVTGHQVYAAGLILHHTIPWSHVSPDAVVYVPPGIYHNKHMVFDVNLGGGEIKNPVFQPYVTKSGRQMLWPHYSSQVHNQMDTFCWQWNDFICSHSTNEKSEPKALDERGPGVYRVCQTFITRVYFNKEYNEKVLENLREYKKHLTKEDLLFTGEELRAPIVARLPNADEQVRVFKYKEGKDIQNYEHGVMVHPNEWRQDKVTGQILFGKKLHKSVVAVRVSYPPYLATPKDMPDVYVLPYKRVLHILTVPFDEATGKYAAPIDERGEMVGKVHVEVDHMWDQRVMRVKWHDLEARNDTCEELEMRPFIDPADMPTREQIENPALKQLMEEHPSLSLGEIIFKLVTHELMFPTNE